MAKLIQPSFAKGEVAPELHGRVDTAMYDIGLATARNTIVHTYGGISNRQGLTYLGPVADHLYAPRLVKFQFKTTDTYVLEFGDEYMRVLRDDGHVLNTEVNISGATNASPVVITATAHGFSNGEEVYIEGVLGMTQLNQNRYYIQNVTANTFELIDQVTGANVDGTAWGTYTSGGTVATVYELVTPYDINDVFELNFVQSADVMTIVHENYAINELARTDHNAWTLTELTFAPQIDTPADQTVTVNTTGPETDRYRVTAIDRDTGEESLPGLNDSEAVITGITQANPGVVSSTAHGFSDGDEVQLDNVVGMTEVNTQRYYVANSTANDFELTDIDGFNVDTTNYTAYSSGGIARQTFVEVTNNATTRDATIAWTAVTNAERYAVYRQDNGVYGLMGETELTTFDDENYDPDTSQTPPIFRNPFSETGDQPRAVGYYEQRRVFGGTDNKPDTSEFSAVGSEANFNRSNPVKDDDAITATLNSRQVNEIRHYVALNDLVVLTSGSEWKINAGQDSAFTSDTIRQRPQSEWGSSRLPPHVVGSTILYIEENDARVRSLGYSLQKDGYVGSNLNILSRHLLTGYQIVDWAYSHSPESRVYMVRNDGVLLTLSFDQEQEIVAWTRWDTSGDFESVTSLRHDGSLEEDHVYFVVKRTVNGNTVRYIEELKQPVFEDVRDAVYLDSVLSYDEPVTITGATSANPVVITATAHGFSNGDEVDIFDIKWTSDIADESFEETQPDQLNTRRYTVANSTANTFELTDSDGNNIDGSAFNSYVSGGTARLATATVTGLEHLEGRDVVALCDGNVVSGLTVSDASLTFDRKFSRIHVGLRYVADVETLPLEVPSGGTIQGMDKYVPKVTVRLDESRGLQAGPDADNLVPMKQREFEKLGDPTDLFTGDKEIYIDHRWEKPGKILIRQVDPLPMNILAIIPDVETGEL